MDETTMTPATSSSSSTTAAAAAVNSSKTTTLPTAASTNTMKTNTVKLVIKSSNQQYDDHIIESDLQWTVMRLKKQISMVYPSKPAVNDQKLIYSGQLLNDKLLLKDVIRNYKDVYTQNHIFHLVCSIKNTTPPSTAKSRAATSPLTNIPRMSVNAEGLRQRRTTDPRYLFTGAPLTPQQQAEIDQLQQQQQSQQQPQYPFFMNPQYIPQAYPVNGLNASQCPPHNPNPMPFTFPGQFNMQSMATQQVAMYHWMQQVYAQYMERCMRMSNNYADMPNPIVQSTDPLPPNAFWNSQMPSFIPHDAIAANIGIPPSNGEQSAADAALAPPVDGQAVPAAAEQEPQRRFPNIVQEEGENNDWLDSFYSITRLAIFLTIMYFNSSPLRCFFVVVIATVIYLYHIGVIRVHHERNNNNINRNNNADADQIRQGVQQVQRAQEAEQQQQQQNNAQLEPNNPPNAEIAVMDAANVAPGEQNNAAAVPSALPRDSAATNAEPNTFGGTNEEENNSVSVIGLVRTFVVTFFTSLLPEAPAAL